MHREEVLFQKRSECIEKLQKIQAASKVSVLRRRDNSVKTSYADTTLEEDNEELNHLREELFLSNFPADWYI